MGGTLIRRRDTSPVLWGDEISGFASDHFFAVTPDFAVLTATVPPGKYFRASETSRPVFDSDEALYVLQGEYTIHDPKSGDVRVAKTGDTITIKGPQWHFGYNFTSEPLRIFEVVAPLDLSGEAGGDLPKAYVSHDPEELRDFPANASTYTRSTYVVRPPDCAYVLHGRAHPSRLDVVCSTPRVGLFKIDLLPGQRTDPIQLSKSSVIVPIKGKAVVRVAGDSTLFDLETEDAASFEAGDSYEIHNLGDQPSTCLVAVAGSLVDALTPSTEAEHASS